MAPYCGGRPQHQTGFSEALISYNYRALLPRRIYSVRYSRHPVKFSISFPFMGCANVVFACESALYRDKSRPIQIRTHGFGPFMNQNEPGYRALLSRVNLGCPQEAEPRAFSYKCMGPLII